MKKLGSSLVVMILIAAEVLSLTVGAVKSYKIFYDEGGYKIVKLSEKEEKDDISLFEKVKDWIPFGKKADDELSAVTANMDGLNAVGEANELILPDLIGLDSDTAQAVTKNWGFEYFILSHEYSDQYPENTVIWQDPSPRTARGSYTQGMIISVWLSKGPSPSMLAGNEYSQYDDYGENDGYSTNDYYDQNSGYSPYEEVQDGQNRENNVQSHEEPERIEVCQAVGDYYERHYGVRPPCIRVESIDGDIVTIHLYEALSDHDATWDWYFVNINTGDTSNFMGDSFNLFYD